MITHTYTLPDIGGRTKTHGNKCIQDVNTLDYLAQGKQDHIREMKITVGSLKLSKADRQTVSRWRDVKKML